MLAGIVQADNWNYLGRQKAWEIVKAFIDKIQSKLDRQETVSFSSCK